MPNSKRHFLIAILCLWARVAAAHNGAVALAYPLEEIAVDGDLADWPERLPRYAIERPEAGAAPEGKEDFSGSFRVGYSAAENALYVAIEVADDQIVLRVRDTGWNTQDGCEIYLDLSHPLGVYALPVQSYMHGEFKSMRDAIAGPIAAAVRWGQGSYSYEWRLDIGTMSEGKIQLAPGTALGFDVVSMDKDNGGSYSWMAWGAGAGKYQTRDLLGDMLLVGEPDLGGVQGQVGRADAQQRVANAHVVLESNWGEGASVRWQTTADAQGAFSFAEVPAGQYRIWAIIGTGGETRDTLGETRDTLTVLAGKTSRVDLAVTPSVGWVQKAGSGQIKKVGSGQIKNFQHHRKDRQERGFGVEVLTGYYISDIHLARDGVLWIATDGGLHRFDGEQIRTFARADGLPHENIRTVYEDRDGTLWLGMRYAGVVRYDGATFTHLTIRDGLIDNFVRAIYQDAAGRVWIGTQQGLSCYSDGKFVNYTEKEGLLADQIAAIAEDASGRLWVAARDGVSVIEEGYITPYRAEGDLNPGTTSLAADGAGGMWVGALSGLLHFDGRALRPARWEGKRDPLSITSLALADDKRLWMGSWDSGIGVYDGAVAQTISTGDGLVHPAVTRVLQDKNGGLWIATESGISYYRPPLEPPAVHIEDAIAERSYGAARELSMPSTQRALAFVLGGASATTHSSRLAYRYRLRGYEDDWQVTRQQRVDYAGLPRGDYTFEVQSADRDLNYSTVDGVRVHVHVPYDMLALFGLLTLVLGGLVVALGYALKQRRGRNRAREALMRGMEEELQTAHQMQMGLMPTTAPQIQGLRLAGRCIPANHVGGDFFQYFERDEHLLLCMADVTGHAMEAAIPVVMFSGILDSQMEAYNGLEELYPRLNRSLQRVLQQRTFVCFAMGEVQRKGSDGSRVLRIANAACPSPYHFSAATGKVVELEVVAYPLGVSTASEYRVVEAQLEPGDCIAFCSDGIIEAENEVGELFGYERTSALVEEGGRAGLDAEEMLAYLFEKLATFVGSAPAGDDRTCIVLEVQK